MKKASRVRARARFIVKGSLDSFWETERVDKSDRKTNARVQLLGQG